MFKTFDTWKEVLAYARKGEPLYYQPPMDRHPTRVECEPRTHTMKCFPPGSRGRGKSRTCDPFVANKGHLERFRRREWLEETAHQPRTFSKDEAAAIIEENTPSLETVSAELRQIKKELRRLR